MKLTQKDEQGNWYLRGVSWGIIRVGQTITRDISDRLYGALYKLMKYEDTGLTPEEIMDGRMLTGWIPVDEKLPTEDMDEVLVTIADGVDGYVSMDIYNGDDWDNYEGVIAWMPMPEPYKPQALKSAGDYADNDTLMLRI